MRRAVAQLAKKTEAWSPDSDQVQSLLTRAVVAASDACWEMSGRMFSGICGPVTVRPLSRPVTGDERANGFPWFSGSGVWGGMTAISAVLSHYGLSDPSEVELGVTPVRDVSQVLIDGVVIPPAEYEVRDYRTLVRLLPAAGVPPTQRYGWPTAQRMDLPDSEPGTFSVTFTFGQPVPEGGRLAAQKLAEVLVLPSLGDSTSYPTRITQISRQGVSAQVASVVEIMKAGGTGIYEVDEWVSSVNPRRLARQAAVWSPDVGRARRLPFPTRAR